VYLPTNYVTPQYNASPDSGFVLPPNGWGIQYTNQAPKKSCGMGMFESMDFSTWGLTEWLVIAAAGGVLLWLLSGAEDNRARARYEKKVMEEGGWGVEPKRKRRRRRTKREVA